MTSFRGGDIPAPPVFIMKIDTRLFASAVPIERYRIGNRWYKVYRADLVPKPPLAPYLKMIELEPFLHLISSQGFRVFGYYAVPESEWVVSIPSLCESVGMQAVIGLSKTKVLPSYSERIRKNLYLLSPNIYAVNYSRTRKYVEGLRGFMAPMGLECKEVVDGLTDFLDESSPLPRADSYVVPTGSGVALSGILNHLRGRGLVVGVCTRPVDSIARVIARYVAYRNFNLVYRDAKQAPIEDPPFPMHPYWDQNAYCWMLANIGSLRGIVCFVNLGSGVNRG